MKAVWYTRQGPAAEVLLCGEQPTPAPGTGEVLVRLHASAVNPADAKRRAGGPQFPMDDPLVIPNSDGAGVIQAVGAGVDGSRIGERVWLCFGQRGRALGTAAEFICLAEEFVTRLPDGLDFAAGATLGIPCMTAHCGVFLDGPVAGKTILVTGGAGAVGHYAIQLAKWGGAVVFATTSTADKARHAERAGADGVIDYVSEDVAARIMDLTAGRGVDRIIDVDAGANLECGLRVLRSGGTWVSYAMGAAPSLQLPLAKLIRGNLALRGLYLPGVSGEARRGAQRAISRWLGEARAPLLAVDRVFPLRDTAAAHLAVEKGNKIGTVIVDCTTEPEVLT